MTKRPTTAPSAPADRPHATLDDLSERLLDKPASALSRRERSVLTKIMAREPVSRDPSQAVDDQDGLGQRLADAVARIGGSWGFIGAFGIVLVGWVILNSVVLAKADDAFDPYPYVFLNLMLSMLAAIQAPIIMMSQNRQAAKDRLTANGDYEVNLRTELEILRLHAKIDHLVCERLDAIEAKIDGRSTS